MDTIRIIFIATFITIPFKPISAVVKHPRCLSHSAVEVEVERIDFVGEASPFNSSITMADLVPSSTIQCSSAISSSFHS